jgi:hypothetical protein
MSIFENPIKPPKAKSSTSSPRSARRPKTTANFGPPLRDPRDGNLTLEEWRDLLLAHEDISLIDSATLCELIEFCKADRDNQTMKGHDSEVADKAFRAAQAMYRDRQKTDAQEERQDALTNRLQIASGDLEDLEMTIAHQEENMTEYLENRRAELNERQAEEMEDLAAEWESEKRKRHYDRSSQALRHLRVQANFLLNHHRYDEMRIAVQQADALHERECRENHKRWCADFEEAAKKLQMRHDMEQQKLDTIARIKRWEHGKAKTSDLRAAKQRIRNLETEMDNAADAEKFWTLKYRFSARRLGKRPQIRKNLTGKAIISVQDFNMLPLPSLTRVPAPYREPFTVGPALQRVTGESPKYQWL